MQAFKLLCLVLLLALVSSATFVDSPVWVTGDGTAHALDPTKIARWVTVFALPTNSATNCSTSSMTACPVTGDSTIVVGSRGFPLLPGASYTYQVLPTGQSGYALSTVFVAAASGDKLVVTWGR
jgi:hypothetical protein